MQEWYRLDNAAKLFPAVSGRRNSSVFRVSATLASTLDPVNAEILQKSVDRLTGRFPWLFVGLRSGVFWNYMDETAAPQTLQVAQESTYPVAPIDLRDNNGFLLRVLYFDRRISVEYFHTLTDGTGGFEFLKALISDYLTLSGIRMAADPRVLTVGAQGGAAEVEDGYTRVYRRRPDALAVPDLNSEEDAYRIKGRTFAHEGVNVVSGRLNAPALNQAAKDIGVTMSAYLIAVLMRAVESSRTSRSTDERPIVMTVPVNLRKLFGSTTLRNFFSTANVGMSQDDIAGLSFEELAKRVGEQLAQKTTREKMEMAVARNMALEANPATRFVPLVIKRFFIMLGFDFFGERKKTITFSNVGRIGMPAELAAFLDGGEMVNYPTRRNPMTCSVASIGDTVTVTFSRAITSAQIPQAFFRFLAGQGFEVTVSSNGWS